MQFIRTFPMLNTEGENGAYHCSVESIDSYFYHIPPPPSINVEELARLLTTIFRSALVCVCVCVCGGGSEITFSPNSDKVCQHFFHDCSSFRGKGTSFVKLYSFPQNLVKCNM